MKKFNQCAQFAGLQIMIIPITNHFSNAIGIHHSEDFRHVSEIPV